MANWLCANCDKLHKERKNANSFPMEADKCTANWRQPNNLWRICHNDFKIMGHPIGETNLCTPCYDRLVMGPMQEATNRLLKQMGISDLMRYLK